MAQIMPAVQLAAHAKSSTLYGPSYGVKFKFFSAWWVTTISYNYEATLRALRALLLSVLYNLQVQIIPFKN